MNRLQFAQAEYAAAFTQLLSLGAYLGILCDTKYFKGTHREIHNTSIWKGIARVVVTLSMFSPFFVICNFKLTDGFVPILFTVYILPALVFSFGYFAFSRKIFQRCRLVTSDVQTRRKSSTAD